MSFPRIVPRTTSVTISLIIMLLSNIPTVVQFMWMPNARVSLITIRGSVRPARVTFATAQYCSAT